MEVLFVSHKYPPSTGGMEKQCFELVSGMDRFTKVHKLVYTGSESKLMFFIKLRYRIRRMLKRNSNISIVHLNDGVMAFFGRYLSQKKKLKVVATVHGLDVVFPNYFFQKVILPSFNRLDRIVCVSKFTANACIERGIHSSKVVVINNGVDHEMTEIITDVSVKNELLERIENKEGKRKVILSLGRAVKRKGFSWFVQNVVPKLPNNYVFVMVGPSKFRKGLSKFVFDCLPNGVQNQINLFAGWPTDSMQINKLLRDPTYKNRAFHLGKVSYEKLLALFDLSDLFVMPNLKVSGDAEGFGLVALEASLRSKFVLAANIEGIRDAIIPNKNGLLIESGNSSDWATSIQSLCSNTDLLIEKGVQGRTFTKTTFGWDKMVESYFNLFQNLSNSNKKI